MLFVHGAWFVGLAVYCCGISSLWHERAAEYVRVKSRGYVQVLAGSVGYRPAEMKKTHVGKKKSGKSLVVSDIRCTFAAH